MNAKTARKIVNSKKQSNEEILKWIEIMANNSADTYFTKTKLEETQVDYFKSLGFVVSDCLTEPNSTKISW